MIQNEEKIKLGFIFFILASLLCLCLIYFSETRYFDVMVNLKFSYLLPIFILLFSEVFRAYRLFFFTRKNTHSFRKPLAVSLFSESLGNLFFPLFKDFYLLFPGLFLFKKKIFLLKSVFFIRIIDLSIYLIILSFFKHRLPFIYERVFESLFIWFGISLLIFFLFFIFKKNDFLFFIKNIFYLVPQTLFILLLQISSLAVVFYIDQGYFTFSDTLFNFFLRFTPVDYLFSKWFFLILLIVTVASLFLESFRLLGKKIKDH